MPKEHQTPCPALLSTNEKFEYFIQRTDKDIVLVGEKLDKMNEKIDKLVNFQGRVIGFATAVSFVVSVGLKLLLN